MDGRDNEDCLRASCAGSPGYASVLATVDIELVAARKAGQPEAWGRIVRRYASLIYGVARGYGLSAGEAADVTQAVFVELWTQLSSVRDPAILRRWLVMVASRKALQRRTHRDQSSAGIVAESAGSPSAVSSDDLAVPDPSDNQIRRVFERLSPRDRELIWYLFLDPSCPTYELIAARLHVLPGTVGALRRDCLRRLRWAVAEHLA